MYPLKPLLHPSFSFQLKCCYFYQDLHYPQVHKASKLHCNPMSTPLYKHNNRCAMMVRIYRLNTVHFKRLSIRSVSCYTLLRAFLLPWPASDCLYVCTAFKEINEYNIPFHYVWSIPKHRVCLPKTVHERFESYVKKQLS